MQQIVRLLTLTFLACSVAAIYPQLCPGQASFSSWNQTRCPASNTCAKNGFSVTGWGCSPFANATVCSDYQTCPSGTKCVSISGSSYSQVFNCVGNGAATTSVCTCKPGVPLPMDPTRKNVVSVGDSLTIGYTPLVAEILNDVAFVQHVPWDESDGGAEETAYGLQCIDLWLASPSGMPISPDLIYFNFGMHDFTTDCTPGNGCVPGQSGNTTVYPGELRAKRSKRC